MFCSNCGNQADENAKFCSTCGNNIQSISNSSSVIPNISKKEYPDSLLKLAEKYKSLPFPEIQEIAKGEDAIAWVILGNKFFNGDGTDECQKTAVGYYHKAAQAGEARGMYALGMAYKNGWHVEKDMSTAAKLYISSSEMGYPYAFFELGLYFQNGIGVEEDHKKSTHWFQKASDFDVDEACSHLAWNYTHGRGVEKDESRGHEFHLKAAENGNFNSMTSVGMNYYLGRGVEKKQSESIFWWKKAIDAGTNDAMTYRNLGIAFEFGDATPANWGKAKEYYEGAAKLGDKVSEFRALFRVFPEDGRIKFYLNNTKWEVKKTTSDTLSHTSGSSRGGAGYIDTTHHTTQDIWLISPTGQEEHFCFNSKLKITEGNVVSFVDADKADGKSVSLLVYNHSTNKGHFIGNGLDELVETSVKKARTFMTGRRTDGANLKDKQLRAFIGKIDVWLANL